MISTSEMLQALLTDPPSPFLPDSTALGHWHGVICMNPDCGVGLMQIK